MPLHDLGGGCWRWGNKGAKYCGKNAKHKALMQGYAENPKEFKSEVSKSEFVNENDIEELIIAGVIDRYDYYAESYINKKERDKIPLSDFADPENRAYPCDTLAHFKA